MPRTLPDGLEIPDDDAACTALPRLGPPPPAPRAAFVLAGLAVAVRGAAALLDPVPPRDGIALGEAVRSLAEAGPAGIGDAALPPLAVFLAAPLSHIGLDPLAALSLVAILAAGLAALPLHALTRRLFDEDAANGAVLLYAVTPPLVRIGSTALGEPVLFLLALLALDAAARSLRHWRPARDAAAAGLAAAGACLARPEGLALVPVVLLAPLPAGGGRPWRNRAAGLAAAALPVLLLVGGTRLLFRPPGSGPEFVPGKSTAVLLGERAPADRGGAATGERHSLPAAALQAVGALPEAMHPVLVPFVLLGLLAALGLRPCGRVRGPLLLVGLAAGLFLSGVVLLEWRFGYGGRRHASPAAVALLPFAGAGLVLGGRLLTRLGGPLARPVFALGVLAYGAALPLLVGALLQRDRAGREAREMGRRIAARAAAASPGAPGPPVATFGEPRIAWYAGGSDERLLKDYGVPPGASREEARRRAEALRRHVAGLPPQSFVVLREGDARIPPGFPSAGAPDPDLVVGRLRAWRAGRVR